MTEANSDTVKTAIVTGGGSGLGKAFCLQLAREGWAVSCADIDQAAAQQTVDEIAAAGGIARADRLDVGSVEAWETLAKELSSDWPQLDLLVNNAGICGAGEVGDAPLSDVHRILQTNLLGTIHGCHAMLPWLKANGGGHIVNISSIASVVSAPSMAAYNASKAGVLSLSETLYAELRPANVGVTVVIPGFFASQLTRRGLYHTDMQRATAEEYTDRSQFTAEDVVQQTLKAVSKRKLYVVVGSRARAAWQLKRIAPTTWLKWVGKIYRQREREFERGD